MIKYILVLLLSTSFVIGDTEFAEPAPSIVEPRKVVLSIKSADDEEINHVLSSANNVLKFYGPENVNMRIVAYYHGIRALLKKEKAIAARIDAMMQVNVEFVACGNTMRTKGIKEDELVDGTEIVTAGIVEMIERVKEGWVNIVP
ncbi:DsrE family protein [Candidatus Sulfurimonas marisnigri]|uniref:DsrE family protein n=1 Tax=Candidatus Sulfurimonas marisnigri TaxID=2740405 RepID=A0A7S7RQS7_9BACT|nr:DsrE family protein [Candidatus Sulfurimonas marisnigri]QOY54868.1 DsrE family protein [Candidatus Sulfurimonas marisnigri]